MVSKVKMPRLMKALFENGRVKRHVTFTTQENFLIISHVILNLCNTKSLPYTCIYPTYFYYLFIFVLHEIAR